MDNIEFENKINDLSDQLNMSFSMLDKSNDNVKQISTNLADNMSELLNTIYENLNETIDLEKTKNNELQSKLDKCDEKEYENMKMVITTLKEENKILTEHCNEESDYIRELEEKLMEYENKENKHDDLGIIAFNFLKEFSQKYQEYTVFINNKSLLYLNSICLSNDNMNLNETNFLIMTSNPPDYAVTDMIMKSKEIELDGIDISYEINDDQKSGDVIFGNSKTQFVVKFFVNEFYDKTKKIRCVNEYSEPDSESDYDFYYRNLLF